MTRYGQANFQIKLLSHEINALLKSGLTRRQIYLEFKNSGKLTCSERAFYNALPQYIDSIKDENTPADNAVEQKEVVVVTTQPQQTPQPQNHPTNTKTPIEKQENIPTIARKPIDAKTSSAFYLNPDGIDPRLLEQSED